MSNPEAEIGVFGGSGFYSLLEGAEEIKMDTPFGPPSDKVMLGSIGGRKVAFIPRHGVDHRIPPQVVPYRANIYAMKKLGVGRIIGPCSVGSLKAGIKPGDFVVCDQFVDRTTGRKDTFYDGMITTHISCADPYCPELRDLAIQTAKSIGATVHDRGTVVIIQGPRFSTRAESKWFSSMGWDVVNMTQYPEAYLAREQEICYVNIALVTDYDVGLEGDPSVKPVTKSEFVKVFNANVDNVKKLIGEMIPKIPAERKCPCGSVLSDAQF